MTLLKRMAEIIDAGRVSAGLGAELRPIDIQEFEALAAYGCASTPASFSSSAAMSGSCLSKSSSAW